MKKIVVHFTLFTLAVIILSSCGNSHGITIAKRHYRSGYYVDFGSRSHTNTIASSIAKTPASIQHKVAPITIAKQENYVAVKAPIVAVEKPSIATRISVTKNTQATNTNILNSTIADQNVRILNTWNNSDVSGSMGDGHHSHDNVSVPFVVIVLCAILIPPLGVGLMYGINSYFWIDLLLTLLFFFPGMIFALIVVLM